MRISTFPNRFSRDPKLVECDLAALFDGLSAISVDGCDDKNKLPLWSPTVFKGNRSQSNSVELTCLVFDLDDGLSNFDCWRYFADYNVLAHTSYSHTPKKHKYRVVLPLEKPIPSSDWSRAHVAGLELWRKLVGVGEPDIKAIKDRARMYYRYSIPASDMGGRFPLHPSQYQKVEGHMPGRCLDLDYSHIEDPSTIKPQQTYKKGEPIAYNNLLDQTGVRTRIAHEMGASISGNVARKMKCGKCGDNSVHFYIDVISDPTSQKFAQCNHRNSCGWYGNLGEL